ncbi:hypothetical protein [Kribbella sp. DT2]|uniref:hypothetical protein n=1 Tax=Kribbella sp. DT2 TaxID=3393427 RepID=UPI003CECC006
MTAADPTQAPKTRRPWQAAGAAAAVVGACAVCCAGPVLAVLGGLSIASLAGALWMPALAVIAVAALVVMALVLRRRRNTTCSAPAGPIDLGMPPTPSRAGASGAEDKPVDTF